MQPGVEWPADRQHFFVEPGNADLAAVGVPGQNQLHSREGEISGGIRVVGEHDQGLHARVGARRSRVLASAPAVANAGHRHAAAIDDLIFDQTHPSALQRLIDQFNFLRFRKLRAKFVAVVIPEHGVQRQLDVFQRGEQGIERHACGVEKIPGDQHAIGALGVDAFGQPRDKASVLVSAQVQIRNEHDARLRPGLDDRLVAHDPVRFDKTHPDESRREQHPDGEADVITTAPVRPQHPPKIEPHHVAQPKHRLGSDDFPICHGVNLAGACHALQIPAL